MSTVEIVDYRDAWPRAFGSIAQALQAALAGVPVAVEHIGSTAVPGLCAKPVIDVLLGVPSLGEVERRIPALSALGYRHRPEHEQQIPLRRYFVRDASVDMPRVHLHAVLRGGPLWRNHLAFRDALRADRRLAEGYAHLKRRLAQGLDKAAYTEAKGPFIRTVLEDLAGGRTPHAA